MYRTSTCFCYNIKSLFDESLCKVIKRDPFIICIIDYVDCDRYQNINKKYLLIHVYIRKETALQARLKRHCIRQSRICITVNFLSGKNIAISDNSLIQNMWRIILLVGSWQRVLISGKVREETQSWRGIRSKSVNYFLNQNVMAFMELVWRFDDEACWDWYEPPWLSDLLPFIMTKNVIDWTKGIRKDSRRGRTVNWLAFRFHFHLFNSYYSIKREINLKRFCTISKLCLNGSHCLLKCTQ